MSLHCLQNICLGGAFGKLEHSVQGVETEEVAVQGWLVLRRRTWPCVSVLVRTIHAYDTHRAPLRYLARPGRNIEERPVVKRVNAALVLEHLRDIRIVHDERKRLRALRHA